MARQKNSKIKEFILWLIMVLLLLIVIAFTARLSNCFTDELKTFYVQHDDYIFATTDEFELTGGKEYSFDVKYVFSNIDKDVNTDYTVEILPVITDETAFDYTVDGVRHYYTDVTDKDFGAAFNLQKYDGYFTIEAPATMQVLFEKLYAGQTVELPQLNARELSYFKIQVTSHDGSKTTEISCYLQASIGAVILDVYEIIV